MSQLRDLTRTCLLGGISATKWESLVRQWIDRTNTSSSEVAEQVWVALRPLCSTHPSEPTLAAYINVALPSDLVPLHALVRGLLTQPLIGSSSPSLAELTTLDAIVQRILFPVLTQNSPAQSLIRVPAEAPLPAVVEAAHNAIDLVKVAFSLPAEALVGDNPLSNTLPGNSAQLLVQILNCIERADALSSDDSLGLLTHLGDIAHFQLPAATVQQLSDWTNHLSYVTINSHSLENQATFSSSPSALHLMASQTPDTVGGAGGGVNSLELPPGSELACSIVLYNLVERVPGAGSPVISSSEMLGLFKMMDFNPTVFFRSMLLASLRLVSLAMRRNVRYPPFTPMAAFVAGRLPTIFRDIETLVSQSISAEDFRTALSSSLAAVLSNSALVESCEPYASEFPKTNLIFGHRLVHACATSGLLTNDYMSLSPLVPHFPVDRFELDRIAANAQDEGLSLEDYLSSKLDSGSSEMWSKLVSDAMTSYSSHTLMVEFLSKRMAEACGSGNIGQLAILARLLHSDLRLLEVVSLYASVPSMVNSAVACLSKLDFGSQSDAQSALSQYGDVVLFIQICAHRFKLRPSHASNKLMFPPLSSTPMSCLSFEERSIARRWIHSIFSPTSEWIDDDLLRKTEPRTLLKLAPTIVVEVLRKSHKGNRDAALGGALYFVGELLSWTLPSVLLALSSAIECEGAATTIHLEFLHTLVTSPGCPLPALQIAGYSLLRIFSMSSVQGTANSIQCGLNDIVANIRESLGMPSGPNQQTGTSPAIHVDVPETFIHTAFNMSASEPFTFPLHHLSLFSPDAVLNALTQEVNRRFFPDREGLNGVPRPVLLITSAVLTTSNVHAGPSFVPYLLTTWVPKMLGCCVHNAIKVETLSFLIGTGVVSLRSKSQARGIVMTHFNKLGTGPPLKEDRPNSEDFDQIVTGFVRWLEQPQGWFLNTRQSLLQKLRLTPEYAGQFVLG